MTSTSSERRARKTKGATEGELGDPSGRAARLKAAEEAAALAVKAAQQAAAAAEAAARTAQELRAEIAAEKGDEEEEEEEEEEDRRNRRPRTPPRDRRRSQSPLRDRRRRGGGRYESPQGRVVYRDSGSGTSWPMLDKTNYYEWSQTMKLRMQARDLWEAVEGGPVQFRDDRRALEVIVAAVPKELGLPLLDKATAKEAWDAIAATRIGVDRVRRATLQRLRREWENIDVKPGEPVEDFALRLSTLHQQLVLHGDRDIDEARVVEKFLRTVPTKYAQIVVAIEQFLDFEALTLEEVTGRLKAVDDREAQAVTEPVSINGKLLYTEEQWRTRLRKEKKGAEEAGGSSFKNQRGGGGGPSRGGGRGRGRGAGRGGRRGEGNGAGRVGPNTCLNCHQEGHWARECPQPRRDGTERGGGGGNHGGRGGGNRGGGRGGGNQAGQQGGHEGRAQFAECEEDAALFLSHGFIEMEQSTPELNYTAQRVEFFEPRARAYLGADDEEMAGGWYLDSGATHHMTGRRDLFSDLNTDVRGTVRFGDASKVEIKGVGSIVFEAKTGEHRVLHGVYFIPALKNSIMSLGQLDENGSKVVIDDGVLRIWERSSGRLLAKVRRGANRLYVLHMKTAQPVCLAARRDEEAWQWHERFGHLNFEALRRLGKEEMARGMPKIDHVEQVCDTCVTTKQRRRSFPAAATYRAQDHLELVHGDLCGPVTPATSAGNRYILLLVDDATRFMWAVLLSSKDAAADAIKKVKAAAEVESGRKLKVLRTDNGGEFTVAEFAAYCANEGVKRHYSAPHSPQQNGVVERRNQTVVAMARALLKQRQMPAKFWGEAVMTAVHILNRSPTKALGDVTPYEAWHGRAPTVGHLKVFGCVAYTRRLSQLRKLDDRGEAGVFIGYAEGAKAYRVFDPASQRVRVSRDVVFDEGRGWDWTSPAAGTSGAAGSDFVVEFPWEEEVPGAGGSVQSHSSPQPHSASPEAFPAAESVLDAGEEVSETSRTPSPSPAPASPQVEHVTPLEDDEERLDTYHNDEQLRYRTIDGILGGEQEVPPPAQRLFAELHLTHSGEPISYAEAKDDPAWQAAMKEELRAVERNGTWELVSPRAGHRPISLKWVYKLKKDEKGDVIKHKARLVARGFVQQEGVDYEDVFAPVARIESVRLLLALAAQEGWTVHHMDVKSAFLNGELKEEVYVQQPPGFAIPGEESKVYRLHKALYGLKQAPRAWNAKLDSTLKEMGFKQSKHEAAIYRKGSEGSVLLVGVYVDDLIITGAVKDEVKAFKERMKSTFEMSDLGLLSFYLGIEVQQGKNGTTMRQTHYAKKILELGSMSDCNPAATPMEERLKLSKHSTAKEVNPTQYRRLVGSLRYLVHTRPDLAFSVGYVSRFLEKPTTEHQQAVKRVLRYLAGTLDYGLQFKRAPNSARFVGYCDSDLAGDIDSSKSTTGCLFFFGNSLVSWQSIKQRVVALSSCEAEYVAMTSAATQALWLSRLLADLLGRKVETVELRVDNKSAIALAKNPVFHDRSKHIRVKQHFIRDCIEEGSIRTEYIPTADQLADILTKALGKAKLEDMRSRIGIKQIKKG